MRVSRFLKSVVAASVVALLAACGGGGSSSGCQSSNPTCTDVPDEFSVVAVDGVWLGASLQLYVLTDFLAVGPGGPFPESLIDPATTTDPDTGRADDIVVSSTAGNGPFVLVASGTGATDSTTGTTPAIETMTRIITLDELQAGTRLYVTPFTTLGTLRAAAIAPNPSGGSIAAQRNLASEDVLQLFGFGINPGATPPDFPDVHIYTTPAVIDETTTDLAAQQDVAAHRAALETFAEVVEEAAAAAGVSGDEVMAAISAGFDLIADGGSGPVGGSTLEDLVDEANTVDPDYLTDQGRLPVSGTPGNEIEVLLGADPTGLGTPEPGANAQPAGPDFDGDGVPNDVDLNAYDSGFSLDDDGDGADDVTADNCVLGALDDLGVVIDLTRATNPTQQNTDGDAFGDNCDNDADGDGSLGNGSGGPGTPPLGDPNDQNSFLAVDVDGDGIDDVGGPGRNGPDNCVTDKVMFGIDSDFFGLMPGIDEFTLSALQAANPNQEDDDNDGEGNACDEDADDDGSPGDGFGGSGVPDFGAVIGDPDDLDPDVSPNDTDSDGVANATDNCPNTSNVSQAAASVNANGLAVPFGIACDADEDGWPEPLQDHPSGQFTSITDADNCPDDANVAQTDGDGDGFGDACDTDNDNDGVSDALDADPASDTANYHFDLFYTQQSSDATDFQLATRSESVLTTLGALAGGSNVLTLATSGAGDVGGAGTGNFDAAAGFETIDTAITYGGAACAGAGCLAAATPTAGAGTGANAGDPVADAVTYAEPTLSADADSGDLAHWGASSFIGSGRIVLDAGAGSPLATAAEQGLAVLQYTDGLSANADLNGQYGFVELQIDYDSGANTNGALVSTTSRVFDATFNGAGAITANGPMEQFDVSVGRTEGTVTYTSTPLALSTYTVLGTGVTDIDTGTFSAIADADGEVLTLGGSTNSRGYGVRLGSFGTADAAAAAAEAAGTFDLRGIVMQPARDNVVAYDLSGATVSFTDVGGGQLTANLNLSGTAARDVSTLDAEDDALPTVAPGSGAAPSGVISEPFNIGTDGRFGPVQFGLGGNLRAFDMEGFFVPGRGLLIRYIESSLYTSGGAGGGGISFWCGVVPTDLPAGFAAFVDPVTEVPIVPQPTSGYLCGFIQTGAVASRSKVSDDAVAAPGVGQTFSGVEAIPGTFVDESFGQGIVWGTLQ